LSPARQTVFLLDHDPDLGAELGGALRETARRELIADLVERPRGSLDAMTGIQSTSGALGLLVIEGLIGRRVSVAGRRGMELMGAGDLLRPWQDDGEHSVSPFEAAYQVLEPCRLAVLDRRATARIGRWPEVMAILAQRALNRSRAVMGHLVLSQLPRVDQRLHLLLWHLADRWGKVTPEGVVLSLRLSHEIFGALIGAQRPTVTLALRQLTDRGAIRRRPDRTWLLLEQPAEIVAKVEEEADRDVLTAEP
jgi:CRP/FNR family transcriptional regulator, cyclic AMP receptor protein